MYKKIASVARQVSLTVVVGAMILYSSQVEARPWYLGLIDAIGGTVYFFAWPSATYERSSFGGIARSYSGIDIKVKLHGKSFAGTPLWTEVIIQVRDDKISGVRWGQNNAIAVQPGQAIKMIGSMLAELNSEYNDSKSPRGGYAEPHELSQEDRRYYEKQCAEGDDHFAEYACWRIMTVSTSAGRKAAAFSRKGCIRGDLGKCIELGAMYEGIPSWRGSGLPENGQMAMGLYRKACAGSESQGCLKLADGYRSGLGDMTNYHKAIELYQWACNAGEATACFNVASMYLDGMGVPANPQQGYSYYDLACRKGMELGCKYRDLVAKRY